MELELAGKSALVTGGSRGLGKAIARRLASEGVRVAVVARGEELLYAAAAELSAETGAHVVPIVGDTSSDDDVKRFVSAAAAALGSIDILVNAAAEPGGQTPPPKLDEIRNDNFWPDINTKVLGYLRVIREVVPYMRVRGGGRIVNVSGLAARTTGSTIGSIRNVAVSALTKNLADELAADHIGVVAVHPGITKTEKVAAIVRAKAEQDSITESEADAKLASSGLLGRIVTPDEVATIVVFLASPKAVAINGDSIATGGGVRGPIFY
jgi:NAD(P)-dependent dehydrogenase (short-subunit alcohol dehydrogenase family)